jgi:hypothetical protein
MNSQVQSAKGGEKVAKKRKVTEISEESNSGTIPGTNGKRTKEDPNGRVFDRYIAKLFKKCHPPTDSKSSRYTLASPTTLALNELAKQFILRVLEEWLKYARENEVSLLSDGDVAELISQMWKVPPKASDGQGWKLHEFSMEAIDSYRKSMKEEKKQKEIQQQEVQEQGGINSC